MQISFATSEMKRETESKCLLQLFLGSFLGTHWSAIVQFFSVSLATVPEVFANVNSVQFPFPFNFLQTSSAHF